MLFFIFREDYIREIIKAFIPENFTNFPREKLIKLNYLTLMEYEIGL
jgi:bisphosphoglycerate-independent phosphoglycerate mutase (AlkP superfamily)